MNDIEMIIEAIKAYDFEKLGYCCPICGHDHYGAGSEKAMEYFVKYLLKAISEGANEVNDG